MSDAMNCYFAISKVCNLRCTYCYVPEYNKSDQNTYDARAIASAERFAKKVANEELNIASITLHGAEPTILSAEGLGHIINLFGGITEEPVSIQTNGTRLTPDYVDTLVSIIGTPDAFDIGISMDGHAQVHNKQRNKTWDVIVRNMTYLKKRGFSIGVLAVITSLTVQNLKEFGYWVEYIKTIVDTMTFKMGEHGFEITADEQRTFARWLHTNRHHKYLQGFMPNICIADGNGCEFYEFDLDGNVYSCNKNYNDEGVFANWDTESFATIMTKRHNLYGQRFVDPECSTCTVQHLCRSGCPLGRVDGKAVDCIIKRQVYQELEAEGIDSTTFFQVRGQSSIRAMVRATFPRLCAFLGEDMANTLVRAFVDEEAMHRTGHTNIVEQFLAHLRTTSALAGFNTVLIHEIARYEHTRFCLATDRSMAPEIAIDDSVMLVDATLAFTPHMTLQQYRYPVHMLASYGPSKSLTPRDTYLVHYRSGPDGHVRDMAISQASYQWLQLMTAHRGLSVQEGFDRLAAARNTHKHHDLMHDGLVFLKTLANEGLVHIGAIPAN